MKKHNFSAGPCILPQEVLKQAANAILNFDDLDLSLVEISHRSESFVKVIEKARSLALELLGIENKGYSALFLHGGASSEFLLTPYNLMNKVDGNAAYMNTGTWSEKAIKEAKLFGEINIVASSKDKNFSYIPKNVAVPENTNYFHCTSNNTIYGTQMKSFPEYNGVTVCDMSSDIFSRKLDFSKFDLIYAGAQKNMGPSGTTLVIVKDEILGKTGRNIPSILDYQIHISKESMFNTPAVFPIYVSMLTLQWLKDLGGIEAIEKINKQKADLLYKEIDRNPFFKGHTAHEDRSTMNATFSLINKAHKNIFDEIWKKHGINGLKGHRSIGGYRASMYNALPIESVQVLINTMKELENKLSKK